MPLSRGEKQTDSAAQSSSNLDEERHLRARFAIWVEDHSSALLRFAYRMTGQMTSAEDLVQETFQQAWQGMHRLRDPKAAPAWLFRILRTRYARWSKQQRRLSKVSIDQLPGENEPTDHVDHCNRVLDLDELQIALEHLENRFKEPLLLVVLEEIPVDQVSRILRLRRGTVLSRVHRAKQKMARILEELRASPPRRLDHPLHSGELSPPPERKKRGDHARPL